MCWGVKARGLRVYPRNALGYLTPPSPVPKRTVALTVCEGMTPLPKRPALNRFYAIFALVLTLGGCGGRGSAPEAGAPSRGVPSLMGTRVMVLPVQGAVDVSGDLDAELNYALQARDGVQWIPAEEVRAAVDRSPALRAPLDALPVEQFLQVEVRRIGDPLYGMLRRAAALTDAQVALIPVQVRERPDLPETPGAVEVRVALIELITGRVLWYGVEQGRPGAGNDPAAVATAMEAMARRLVPAG